VVWAYIFNGRSGFQPAMVRAHCRTCALSVMPGKRRSSIAAENSVPPMLIAAQSRRKSLNMFSVYSRRVDRYRNYSGKACP
jgi:hypothetical protein